MTKEYWKGRDNGYNYHIHVPKMLSCKFEMFALKDAHVINEYLKGNITY